MSSSNSVVDRLKELTAANAEQAKEIELDRLRTNYGLLKARYDAVRKDIALLYDLVTRYEDELRIALEFILASGIELTTPIADIFSATRGVENCVQRQSC